MDNEKLIEAVRSFPCLWQVSSISYKDLRAKENAWKEVASMLGGDCTVEVCVRRWRTLRDKFVRELKKTKCKKSGDAGPFTISCWPLFRIMSFVGETVKHKSTTTNFNPSVSPSPTPPTPSQTVSMTSSAAEASLCEDTFSEVEDTDVPGPSTPPVVSPKKKRHPLKRKREEFDDVEKALMERLEQLKKPHQDETDAFGNHIAARLRTFTARQYARACLEIETVLVNIQFPSSETCDCSI